jgi:hypothetical protein
MRQLEFNATIAEEELKRLRRKRPSSGWVAAGLVLAFGWVFAGVSLSPSVLEFDSLPVGIGEAREQVRLTNRGISDFRPDRIAVEGPAAKDFQVKGSCGVVLPGQSCVLEVQFHPQEPGEKQAELVVRTPDGKQMATELSGVARPAAVSVSPGELDFGQVEIGSSSNTGKVVLHGEGWFHVHGVSLSRNNDQYKVVSDTCNGNAGGLRTCVILVRFAPQNEGALAADLVIEDDGIGSPHHVSLKGAATPAPGPTLAPGPTPGLGPTPEGDPVPALIPSTPVQQPVRLIPAIQVDPPVLDFSSGGRQQQVNVFNRGTGALQIQVNLQGPNPDRFTADVQECSGQIQPGRACSILVVFHPKLFAPKKSYGAQLDIAHNAPNMTTQSVALRWNRTDPVRAHVTVNPSSLDFSPSYQGVAMHTAAPQSQRSITILNDGPVALNQLNLRIGFMDDGKAFSHSSDCRQLEQKQQCTETVSFNPVQKTKYSEKLYIFEGAMNELATVDLQATLPAPPTPPTRVKVPAGANTAPPPNHVIQ